MNEFILTQEETEALYEYISRQYINYENEVMLKLVKRLREHLYYQESEKKGD